MARPTPRPRAASAVCIDLISARSGPSRLIAPMPSTMPPARQLKKVIAGSSSPAESSAKLCSGGVCPSANSRCRSSRARTSGWRGSSRSICTSAITLAPYATCVSAL